MEKLFLVHGRFPPSLAVGGRKAQPRSPGEQRHSWWSWLSSRVLPVVSWLPAGRSRRGRGLRAARALDTGWKRREGERRGKEEKEKERVSARNAQVRSSREQSGAPRLGGRKRRQSGMEESTGSLLASLPPRLRQAGAHGVLQAGRRQGRTGGRGAALQPTSEEGLHCKALWKELTALTGTPGGNLV